MSISILVADDDFKIRRILSNILSDEGYEVTSVANGPETLNQLNDETVDLLLLDLKMPGIDGLQVMEEIAKRSDQPQVIIISAHGTIQRAVKAVQLGAFDFLEKPVDMDRLLITVKNALKQKSLVRENIKLKTQLQREEDQIIGDNDAMQSVYRFIKMAANCNARILITGENGTGKDLLAKKIHDQSARSANPFVMVNCAAIPPHLFESELFGYEKGAFTGAVQRQRGKFELAEGGTLILNEITEILPDVQSKLLHAIENKHFYRLGGNQAYGTDVRIIAATNRDVHQAMEDGLLREDLYYRLNVLSITLPPLRERGDDVILLAEYFIQRISEQNGAFPKKIADTAVKALKKYHWPGNIRELQNLIQRLMVFVSEDTIDHQAIQAHLPLTDIQSVTVPEEHLGAELKLARREWERQFILKALRDNGWIITKAADVLNIERTYLHRLIKQLGIDTQNSQ
ncbi:MAG: response regulator [Caldithrix sp.]|nr:response regulator [Caldithrix sp.]